MYDYPFNLSVVHPSWQHCLEQGLAQLNKDYLHQLSTSKDWLPSADKVFSALSLPLSKVNYVLFGESPYPRAHSANGYAFWDAAVKDLWSETGLSKQVNRATSLRNIIKMLLVTEGLLDPNQTTQEAIAQLDKSKLIQTNAELFNRFLDHGFLLLNATLVLDGDPKKDAKAWHAFMRPLLNCLIEARPHVKFLLLGNIANMIDKIINKANVEKLYAEHPYNISFITNPKIQEFFAPFHLLTK